MQERTDLGDYELDIAIGILFDIIDALNLLHCFVKNIKDLIISLVADILRLLVGSLHDVLKILQILFLEAFKLLDHPLLGVVLCHIRLLGR